METGEVLVALPFDTAVERVLASSGECADADRAWMFTYNEDATLFRNTHEWCRPGVRSFVGELQDVPVSLISWLQLRLAKNQAVDVRDIGALPRAARALKTEFQRQGNRRVLSVPVFHRGRLWGCLGYDRLRDGGDWPPAVAIALAACGRLIAAMADARLAGAGATHSVGAVDQPRDERGVVYLREDGGLRRLPIKDIIGVRSERDYTRVFVIGGRDYLELRSLKDWLGILPGTRFQQIHRSALVSVQHLRGLTRSPDGRWQVRFTDRIEPWDVSKGHLPALRSRFGV